MHALVTVFTKNARNIHRILNNFSYDEGDGEYFWDYASIGGRYHGFIPVKENTKVKIYGDVFGVPPREDEFQFQDMHYEHAQGVKYVSCARLRSIDYIELNRMRARLGCDVFNPYAFIIDNDGEYTWVNNEPDQRDLGEIEWVHNLLSERRRQYWYVIVVDCHF